MAAASHLNIIPPEQKTSFGPTKPPAWLPRPLAMHVARPKSAKGRTRAPLNGSRSIEGCSLKVPSSPLPLTTPVEDVAATSQRASSSQLAQVFPTEIPDLLQQVPLRTSSSLNKYRVLPSISRKELRKTSTGGGSGQQQEGPRAENEELRVRAPPLKASPQRGPQAGSGESAESPPFPAKARPLSQAGEGTSPASGLNLEEPGEGEPRLLLAIRSPSGERFQHFFRPTDSLKTVLAVAAQRNAAAYPHCSLETVEVPRRTFSDLTKSLQECAIPHKSVLCILRGERDGEP